MLPLDLPAVQVTRTEGDGSLFAIHAGCEGRPEQCPSCGGNDFIGHGQHEQLIMDLPHQGRFTCIHLLRKRYRCKRCGATFFHPIDWLDKDHNATRRFVDRIATLSLQRSFSDLSREYGVNEKTIRNIFYGHYAKVIATTHFATPDYLGIDELKIAGSLRGVITNIGERAAIEFLPKNTKQELTDYFTKMPDRERVQGVAMDCAQHYKALAQQFFPKARIVADKYHVVRAADVAVDKIRLKVRSGIDSRRTQLRLKKDKFVLKTRAHNLTEWQKEQLAGWRMTFPEIGQAYDTKEALYGIYDAKNEREARLRFQTWQAGIPSQQMDHWKPILTTFDNWGKEIFEYFNLPITNAYTECQNGLTRAIDRIGRGYSFDVLRVKLLLAPKKTGIQTSYRSIQRKKQVGTGLEEFFTPNDFQQLYETIQVPDRKVVTWGVDLMGLADWLDIRSEDQE